MSSNRPVTPPQPPPGGAPAVPQRSPDRLNPEAQTNTPSYGSREGARGGNSAAPDAGSSTHENTLQDVNPHSPDSSSPTQSRGHHGHHGHHNRRSRSPVPEWPELPEAPPSKVYGKGYSSRHKVPKAQDYAEIQKTHEQQAEEYDRLVREREEAMQGREENGEMSSGQLSPAADVGDVPGDSTGASLHEGETSGKSAKGQQGAGEKERLMEQMTANLGEFTV